MEQYEKTIKKLSKIQKKLEEENDCVSIRYQFLQMMTICQDFLNENDDIVKARQVINGARLEIDDLTDDVYEDIDQYDLQYKKFRDSCTYCGYGNSKHILMRFKSNGKYGVIKNWCGCSSYGKSYEMIIYTDKNDALNSFGQ